MSESGEGDIRVHHDEHHATEQEADPVFPASRGAKDGTARGGFRKRQDEPSLIDSVWYVVLSCFEKRVSVRGDVALVVVSIRCSSIMWCLERIASLDLHCLVPSLLLHPYIPVHLGRNTQSRRSLATMGTDDIEARQSDVGLPHDDLAKPPVEVGRENIHATVPPHETYEGRHRFDPGASWSIAEERKVVRKTDLYLLTWLCVMVSKPRKLA